jgi:acetyl-CoA carboxylase biotin carboxyl carrier protein
MPGKKPFRTGVQESERSWELKEIQGLIDLLIDREIQEFELEKDGMRIRILRGRPAGTVAVHPVSGNSHAPVSAAPAEPLAVPAAAPAQEAPAPEPAPETPEEGLHVMKSPMVGTFFSAPSPDAPPFVNLGDRVHVGQVLCIVEAMKLMNEIESEFDGEIVRIHVENGQPVEYGQPLFTIKST